jgi:acetolactate synthase-1/3 small subunit
MGDTKKIDNFLDLMRKYGIKEMSRTGLTAIMRGSKSIEE